MSAGPPTGVPRAAAVATQQKVPSSPPSDTTPPIAPASQSSTHNPPPAPHIHDHELLRRIGQGSYGEVWMARSAVGTLRAVKIVHRQAFERAEHFEREFKGLQKFEPISRSHEGLVDILHIGREEADGYFYYVMELADAAEPRVASDQCSVISRLVRDASTGSLITDRLITDYFPKTLRSEIQRCGRLPVANCIDIGLKLAAALQHLHKNGLVHRDIKPSNIIFVDGAPKLADIGLVTAIDEAHSLVGTVGYIPPEGPGTPQADLYSLGKVLYEISLGKNRQDFPQLPPDLRSQPDHAALLELNEVALKACESDFRKRYQTAQQMYADLALLQQGQSIKRKRATERRLALAKKLSVTLAACVLLATGGGLLFNRFSASTLQRSNASVALNSIAVLPLVNQSPWPAHEYLGHALTEETMNALATCAELSVARRLAVFAFKRATNDLQQIGAQLGVHTMLAGTFLRSSNGLRVAVRLITTVDGTELWSADFDRQREELHLLGAALSRQVARALNVQLEERVIERLQTNLVRRLRAYGFRQEAVNFPRNTKAGLNKQIELLNQALVEDSEFAQAYLDLANTYSEACDLTLPPTLAMTEARKNATRALQIDPTMSGPHMTLGWVSFNFDWDTAQAQASLEQALKLDPQNVPHCASYAVMLQCLKRFDEAERVLRQAEQLDPKAHAVQSTWCWRYFNDHRFEDQMRAADRLLATFTNNFAGLMHRAWALERLDRLDEALAEARRLVDLDAAPDTIAFLGFVHARLGHRSEAEKTLQRLKELAETSYVSGFFPAQVWVGLGESDRAFACLEQAVQQRSSRVINQIFDPRLDPLRTDPRFLALLKKVGLEK